MKFAGLLLVVAAVAPAAACTRIEYRRLGWGGYWSVDFVVPWRR